MLTIRCLWAWVFKILNSTNYYTILNEQPNGIILYPHYILSYAILKFSYVIQAPHTLSLLFIIVRTPLMDIQVARPRQLQFHDQIKLNSPVTHITSCKDFIGVVCLDDTMRVWKNHFNPFDKKIFLESHQQFTGISDICFNHYSTTVATTCIGSEIKIYDLENKQSKSIGMPALAPWKIIYTYNQLFACVDFGKVQILDATSWELVHKIDTGSAFINSMTITPEKDRIAVGNALGKAYIIKVQDRKILDQYQPHHKMITSIKFSNDGYKLLTGSEDTTLSITDIETKKVTETLQGHLGKVSSVAFHPRHDHIAYSCSYDKTVKTWDVREKQAIHTLQTNDKLRALHIIDKYLLLGGESGFVQFFALQ